MRPSREPSRGADWWVSWREYWFPLFRQRRASAGVGAASLALVFVSAYLGRPVVLPFWGWLEIATLGVMFALIQEIKSQRAMDPEHAAELKRIAVALCDSIMANGAPVYHDGHRANDVVRAKFLDHHGELVQELREWESFPGRESAAKYATYQAIYHDGEARWLNDGWSFGPILGYAQSYVERSVDQDYATEQPAFSVVGQTVVQGQGAGTVARWLNNLDDAEQYVVELQQWVLDMSRLAEVEEWRRLRARRRDVRASLIKHLEAIIGAPKLKQSRCGKGCRAY